MTQKTEKRMGLVSLTVITIINMMGSGIILLPANLAKVGNISILSWAVTAIGAILLAYAFARAGTYSNHQGGMGGYAEYAHGRSGNFMTNYTYFVSLAIANIAIAVTTVGYGASFMGMKLSPIKTAALTIACLWLASALNFGGPKITGKIGNFTIWGVIIPVVGISVIGWFWFDPQLYLSAWNPKNMPLFQALSASISITLWAFLGLESASANSDVVDNPKRNVPLAVLIATGFTAILYIASTSVIAGIVPINQLAQSNAPFGLVFAQILDPTVGKVVIGLMVLSCFGSLLGWQFTIAEVARSSAVTGYFFQFFAKVNASGAPIIGMCVITAAQTLLSLLTISPTLNGQFTVLVNLAVMTNLIPYILSMSALSSLQTAENIKPASARTANIVAFIAGLYSLYALYTTGTESMMYGGLVTFAGWMLYSLVAARLDHRPVRQPGAGETPILSNSGGQLTAVGAAQQSASDKPPRA
ncbi:putrescine-ornithine antiporter [Polaromonas sp.]|uniref:putrescine-ornithine antiporter n=1 Tax=Polaromonas sp. TaxID=1869339 RepID=UPI0013B63CD6|nr:putrescine-ornithine antiporter [Polaromonas sp.]NDP63089.1 putrescine-ornithine antiporter [Polaromonas sp.]